MSAIDLAPEHIQVVKARQREGQWPAPVDVREGNILALPYDTHCFDLVWCANTSQYLSDDEVHTMLREFRRVVRPGGLIAIKDYDITAQQVQPSPPTLLIHLHEALCRLGNQHHRNLFRTIHLPQWLRETGLLEIRQKPTLMVRFQPLQSIEKSFICDFLKYSYMQAQNADLPLEELQTWTKLGAVDSPDHLINHPDFQYRAIQTVFVGRVP